MASILVVTDNVPAVEMVRSALVLAGHEVLVSHQLLPRRHFDLAIVDLERFELAAQARAIAGKVVLFSEATEELTRERVERSGAEGYVRKLGPARLREDVQHLLDA